MKAAIKKVISFPGNFFGKRKNRRLLYLAVLGVFALVEWKSSGLARRTFVFPSNEGNTVVEDRMLLCSPDSETEIRRYLEEILLGPVSPDAVMLFPRETRLNSFMYRDSVVYADLSENAALPLPGGDVFRGLLTLNEGIRRNFSHVKNVKLFIGGNEVFFEDFSRIFGKSADNSKTSP